MPSSNNSLLNRAILEAFAETLKAVKRKAPSRRRRIVIEKSFAMGINRIAEFRANLLPAEELRAKSQVRRARLR